MHTLTKNGHISVSTIDFLSWYI